MSPWARALFSGDYEETMRMLDMDSNVSKLIEKRETLYNISAIFLVIIGSRCLTNTFSQFDSTRDEVPNKEGHTKESHSNEGHIRDGTAVSNWRRCVLAFGHLPWHLSVGWHRCRGE